MAVAFANKHFLVMQNKKNICSTLRPACIHAVATVAVIRSCISLSYCRTHMVCAAAAEASVYVRTYTDAAAAHTTSVFAFLLSSGH